MSDLKDLAEILRNAGIMKIDTTTSSYRAHCAEATGGIFSVPEKRGDRTYEEVEACVTAGRPIEEALVLLGFSFNPKKPVTGGPGFDPDSFAWDVDHPRFGRIECKPFGDGWMSFKMNTVSTALNWGAKVGLKYIVAANVWREDDSPGIAFVEFRLVLDFASFKRPRYEGDRDSLIKLSKFPASRAQGIHYYDHWSASRQDLAVYLG